MILTTIYSPKVKSIFNIQGTGKSQLMKKIAKENGFILFHCNGRDLFKCEFGQSEEATEDVSINNDICFIPS